MAGVKLLNNNVPKGTDIKINRIVNCLTDIPDIRHSFFDDNWGREAIEALLYSPRTMVYGIFHEGKPETIGTVFFTGVFPFRNCYLYAAIFDKKDRTQGKMKDVCEKIKLDITLRKSPSSFTACVIGNNPASSHFLEKLEFKKKHTFEKFVVSNGKRKDVTFYYMINEEGQTL